MESYEVPLRYRLKVGSILGTALVLSLTLNGYLAYNRPERVVIQTKTEVITKEIEPPNQVTLKVAKVVRAWKSDKGAPYGLYEMLDNDNSLKIVQFCDPVPSWTYGDELADVKYRVEKDCQVFLGAKVVHLNPNAYWRSDKWLSDVKPD